MSEPFRLRVLKALTESLESIERAGDSKYQYNLAGCVFRGRVMFGDSDPLPMISILETPVPVEMWISPDNSGLDAGNWDLLIQGFIDNDQKNPTDPAQYLMADVKKKLVAESKRIVGHGNRDILGLGKRIMALEVGPGTVRPSDDYSSVANFWLRISVKIAEDNADPFV